MAVIQKPSESQRVQARNPGVLIPRHNDISLYRSREYSLYKGTGTSRKSEAENRQIGQPISHAFLRLADRTGARWRSFKSTECTTIIPDLPYRITGIQHTLSALSANCLGPWKRFVLCSFLARWDTIHWNYMPPWGLGRAGYLTTFHSLTLGPDGQQLVDGFSSQRYQKGEWIWVPLFRRQPGGGPCFQVHVVMSY